MLPLIGPAIVLVAAVLFWRLSPGPEARSPAPEATTSADGWAVVDFSSLKPGGVPAGWDVVRGTFGAVERDGRMVLEMQAEPMVEGNVTCGQLLTRGGGLRARMRGERSRRATPRFAISLNGDAEFMLRAVPSGKVVEITTVTEQILASAPWTWQPGKWLWLELRVQPESGGSGAVFEGRVWTEGEPRPDAATVRFRSATPPGILRPALRGAPYALRPIETDRLELFRPDQ